MWRNTYLYTATKAKGRKNRIEQIVNDGFFSISFKNKVLLGPFTERYFSRYKLLNLENITIFKVRLIQHSVTILTLNTYLKFILNNIMCSENNISLMAMTA